VRRTASNVLALLDPFSGVAGDMFLGALIDVGLDKEFIEALPLAMGLENIGVRISRTQRCAISAVKVDFDIPPQPHGRHLKQLIEIVERSAAPDEVKARAAEAFRLIASVEAEVHGTTVERVHLHEVGAVDAILDVVGTLWGVTKLGITEVRCGIIALGDGFVETAHGQMPVPAPATARIVEGLNVSTGPAGSGELTTPTGAALVRVLSSGGLPESYVPRRTGYGAGTKEFPTRANVFRITLADTGSNVFRERVTCLTADIDDMTPERLAMAADILRAKGALDVTLTPLVMKKGRPGVRLDVITNPLNADVIEDAILIETSSIGVRRTEIFRRALAREVREVEVEGRRVRVKIVKLPDGGMRVKPESDDVRDAAFASGKPAEHISQAAVLAAQQFAEGV
jgi:pyridinium-3,5-bisthiocarboxylic acid mononucleotide nickel chelatase